ncbi:hypothetical protein D3C86_1946530 [compost metagenome]
MMCYMYGVFRKVLHQVFFYGEWGFSIGQANAIGHSKNMSVNGHGWRIVNYGGNYIGCFPAYTGHFL